MLLQVRRASEAAAAELKRQQEQEQLLTAGGAMGQELAVSDSCITLKLVESNNNTVRDVDGEEWLLAVGLSE